MTPAEPLLSATPPADRPGLHTQARRRPGTVEATAQKLPGGGAARIGAARKNEAAPPQGLAGDVPLVPDFAQALAQQLAATSDAMQAQDHGTLSPSARKDLPGGAQTVAQGGPGACAITDAGAGPLGPEALQEPPSALQAEATQATLGQATEAWPGLDGEGLQPSPPQPEVGTAAGHKPSAPEPSAHGPFAHGPSKPVPSKPVPSASEHADEPHDRDKPPSTEGLTLQGSEPPVGDPALPPLPPALQAHADPAPAVLPSIAPTAWASQAGTAQAAPPTVPTLQLPHALGSPAWSQALGQQVLFLHQAGLASAQLQLHPQDLGALQVHLQWEGGRLSAQFHAAQPEVREAVQVALPQLQHALAAQGLSLGQTQVGSGPGQGSGQGPSRGDEAWPTAPRHGLIAAAHLHGLAGPHPSTAPGRLHVCA